VAVTLDIITNFDLEAEGISLLGKQGSSDSAFTDSYRVSDDATITITGNSHRFANTLATATAVLAYDSSSSPIATFDYGHFWADVDMYIQIISAATNVIFKVRAKCPEVIPGYGKLLAAANTTPITGGAEPSVAAVAKIYLGNYSGGTGNYILTLID